MASSSNSACPSTISSPDITATKDHGNGETITLLPQSATTESQTPITPRGSALTFDDPAAELKTTKSARPTPIRSQTSEGTPTEGLSTTGPTSNPAIQPPVVKDPKAKLNRADSSFVSLRSIMSPVIFGKKNPESGKSSVNHSSTTSPESHTPNFKAILSSRQCPDLDAVNRALLELKLQARAADEPLVEKLIDLTSMIQWQQGNCKKLLTEAMQFRDQQKPEICRALCINIVQNQHSKADTKVYAYNILATQASSAQMTLHFLNEAAKVVQQVQGAEKDKLTSVIAVLRESAVARLENEAAVRANRNLTKDLGEHLDMDLDLEEIQKTPTIPKQMCGEMQQAVAVKDLLKIPEREEVKTGILTPKSEKILEWAGPQFVKTVSNGVDGS